MARTPSTMQELGSRMPVFQLQDHAGNMHTNQPHDSRGSLVMFLSSHCPFVILLKEHLASLTREYANAIAIYGIMSNDIDAYPADGPDGMRGDCEQFNYPFPYLLDESQDIAKAFQAACTPDFFLYDGNGRLFYRGQYDAARPGNESDVSGADLRAAIEALIAGRPAPNDQLPSLGCNIKWKPDNAPSYFG